MLKNNDTNDSLQLQIAQGCCGTRSALSREPLTHALRDRHRLAQGNETLGGKLRSHQRGENSSIVPAVAAKVNKLVREVCGRAYSANDAFRCVPPRLISE